MATTNDPENVVAVIVIERDDDNPCQSISKLRVKGSDLVRHVSQKLNGEILRKILSEHEETRFETSEIYDTRQATYRSLEDADLVRCDLITYIGSRLRVRLRQMSRTQHSDETLAIEGRFYPYDGSINIVGKTIEVKEQPNEPGQETAGNVWDGAVLL